MNKLPLWAGAACLCLTHSPARAQTQKISRLEANRVAANRGAASTKNEGTIASARPIISLAAFLQMRAAQITRLNRISDDYNSRRLKQQTTMAQSQEDLRSAQLPGSFDEKKAARLSGEINLARQKVAADFLAARTKALQTLDSVQRAQLESLATDTRFEVRTDRFYQLFLLPLEELFSAQFGATERREYLQMQSARGPRSGTSKRSGTGAGTGTYGVYGGAGYGGPQYGVYGGYGRGPVGVHVGVGRGGPTIGVGIGGIFGVGRR
ncbi:hypothetical protein [Abditibacterium utsteinense]|nr:hypothetical protein [Abditibacterium utsteinense]